MIRLIIAQLIRKALFWEYIIYDQRIPKSAKFGHRFTREIF